MRKKVKGAIYDTETAQEIARWEGELDGVDDVLYRSKSGKYFVVEVRIVDEEYMERPEAQGVIVPVSKAEAIRKACAALGVDAARPYFVEEDAEGLRRLSILVSNRTYRILRDVAAERGVSMATLVEELVNEGEPFGDENVIFDEIAKRERFYQEIQRKAQEVMEREEGNGLGSSQG